MRSSTFALIEAVRSARFARKVASDRFVDAISRKAPDSEVTRLKVDRQRAVNIEYHALYEYFEATVGHDS